MSSKQELELLGEENKGLFFRLVARLVGEWTTDGFHGCDAIFFPLESLYRRKNFITHVYVIIINNLYII